MLTDSRGTKASVPVDNRRGVMSIRPHPMTNRQASYRIRKVNKPRMRPLRPLIRTTTTSHLAMDILDSIIVRSTTNNSRATTAAADKAATRTKGEITAVRAITSRDHLEATTVVAAATEVPLRTSTTKVVSKVTTRATKAVRRPRVNGDSHRKVRDNGAVRTRIKAITVSGKLLLMREFEVVESSRNDESVRLESCNS